MAWYLSEECIFFSTPGFDARFSLMLHMISLFAFSATIACILSS
jgi:hypothetical protein